MTEQTVSHYEDDEISLLDILVTLAESWKLLVFGPLIAGMLAGALSFLWPKTFESVAIVRLNEADLALLHSVPVLDPLVEKFGLLAEFDGVQEDARQYVAKKIIGKFDKKTNLVTITAVGNTPERAQEMGKAAIDALLKELLPKGKNKDLIEQKIVNNESVISSNRDALDQLQKQMAKSGSSDATLEVVMKYYASITSEVAAKELENIELRKSLLVKGEEVYVQHAGLSKRKVSPKYGSVFVYAALIFLNLLLIYLAASRAWRNTEQRVENKIKLLRIKRAFGLSVIN